MKKIFVCSPYRGNVEENMKLAKFVARILVNASYIPVVPHLYFPQFLDDKDKYERIQGIKLGTELMRECDGLWLVGTTITNGMEYELGIAKEIQIPVTMYDEKLTPIDPDTILLDERIDDKFREQIQGLIFGRRGH